MHVTVMRVPRTVVFKVLLVAVVFGLGLLASGGLRLLKGHRLKAVYASRRQEVTRVLAERTGGPAAEVLAPGYPPPLLRTPIDRETARRLFPTVTDGKWAWDERLIFRRPSHSFTATGVLPHYQTRTNNYGFRNDEDVRSPGPNRRILVSGDSHVDGVCPNRELFTTRLGQMLSGSELPGTVEVLNAAVGCYGPYHYLLVLERYADELQPDVFVATVYGGNDFSDVCLLQRYFHRRGPLQWEPHSTDWAARLPWDYPAGGAVGQSVGQAAYFANNPGDVDVAVDTLASISVEIDHYCRRRDVAVLFVYLPPAPIVQWDQYRESSSEALKRTGLSRWHLAPPDAIADRWLGFLRDRGIPFVDLRPVFAKERTPLYWEHDHHLNPAGHRLIAETLEPRLRELIR